MLRTVGKITSNLKTAKEAIITATNRFWKAKREVWKYRCDITTTWEKEHNITKRKKKEKKKQIQKKPSGDITTTEGKIRTENSKTISTELTNLEIDSIINNRYFPYNFFAININASG